MDSMPFPPGVGGCRAGKGNSSAPSFEVITAEKAIDETNARNYILRNMGWQEGLHILHRQKEQFRDGVRYSWIDVLKDHANKQRANIGS
nr:asparagine synthetase [glutamine-hydrolyzing] 2 [Tanacetum cinerariifolium]